MINKLKIRKISNYFPYKMASKDIKFTVSNLKKMLKYK